VQVDVMTALVSFDRVFEVLDLPPAIADRPDATDLEPGAATVEFEHVGFRYPTAAEVSLASLESVAVLDQVPEKQVLHDVSFRIEPGQLVALVGPSGAGKSTITKLLQRMYGTYDGLIKLDGIDIREINLGHLRSNFGIVLPENFLFSGTVRDNIGIARPDATLDQIVRAAQLAGAEEFIERMPRGYETVLTEGASNLSSGQRQRLAIARALLTDPPVLILDEATSALDAESEAIINANLRKIAQGRTVITISHRLSMLVDADAILVMERGKVYDMGTHDELLERCDIYKQLWYQQNRHAERTSKAAPPLAIGRSS